MEVLYRGIGSGQYEVIMFGNILYFASGVLQYKLKYKIIWQIHFFKAISDN